MNTKLEEFKNKINGRAVTVLGIGVSNTPLIKFLVSLGALVTACDKKDIAALGDLGMELKELGVTLKLGTEYLSNLSGDYIFKTPGMRFDLPQLQEARSNGAKITSEMEVFFELCPAPIIAVTGSDGKTTTTTLIYEMLKQEGYICHLGGNIGKPLLAEIESIEPHHKVILELSSFQLHTMTKSPHIAVITNLSPNHLDMHKDMDEYVDAKKNIFRYQTEIDKLVLNQDNEITRSFAREVKSDCVFFARNCKPRNGCYLAGSMIYYNNTQIMSAHDILLPGVHNIENYMAAISAVWGMVQISNIIQIAKSFGGVEHRIEFVRELNGVKFYNDSIASSPTRAIAGLRSFKQKLIIIAGGYDKHLPFDEYGVLALKHMKQLILIGDTADKIYESVEIASKISNTPMIPTTRCSSLEEAVSTAYALADKKDIVMLSPACASFDMFPNFEARGNLFKKLVNQL